jgi:diphthamide biosynthesis protein 7
LAGTHWSEAVRKRLLNLDSYDAKLRLFDKRATARPLSELDVGGGIWRARWHPTEPSRLLVACMHDGFKVVDASDSTSPSISARLDEHGSLAYGADWTRATGGTVAATCSFYDHSLKSWRL